MTEIYLKRYTGNDFAEMSRLATELFDHVSKAGDFNPEGTVPIKVHFGEKGNRTFIPAVAYDGLIGALKSAGAEPLFIETNVLYRGARTTTQSHIDLARSHGFTQIPIIIADGETGTDYDEIQIDKEFFSYCRIGRRFGEFNQYLVVSHFKGHSIAGFGGALKQLAMGFASRAGKLAQHSGIAPVVSAKRCIQCGICVEKCDFGAITLDPTAIIDDNLCVGCAGCIAVCPEGAIRNRWDAANFYERIAEYAYGAALGKDILYVSFLVNITDDCDCIGHPMDTVSPNIGILAGRDPVALDAACLDLVEQTTGSRPFEKGRKTLEHAEKIGLGSSQYQLIEL